MKLSVKIVLGSVFVYVALAAFKFEQSTPARRAPAGPHAAAPSCPQRVLAALADPVSVAHAQSQPAERLRARYLVAEDGSRQFVGWHDTGRDEDCSFGFAADGAQRCLPATQYGVWGYYSDDQCTVPITGVLPSACPIVTPYALRTDDCGNESVYQLTDTTVDKTYIQVEDADGGIIGCQYSPVSSYTFYTATEVPASSFAMATEQTE
jgi:hypothetical protein